VKILLDTNVLLRLGDAGREAHAEVVDAVDWLVNQSHEIILVPQVLYEYWVVATRPVENNGLGMMPKLVDRAISEWILLFRLLQDERGVFRSWRDLVTRHEVKGKVAHDARLVAAMERHDVGTLLTFNKTDFARFGMINAVTPREILTDGLPA